MLCELYTSNRDYFRKKNHELNYACNNNNNNIYAYKDMHLDNFDDVDNFDYFDNIDDVNNMEGVDNFGDVHKFGDYFNFEDDDIFEDDDSFDDKNPFDEANYFKHECDFDKYEKSTDSKINVEDKDNNIDDKNSFALPSEHKEISDNDDIVNNEEIISNFDKYYKSNSLHISNDNVLMEYIKKNYGKMTMEELYVIYFYIHEIERKKYLNMECQLYLYCEKLANKYNIPDDYKIKIWKKAYNDVHGFYLNKEKGFYKKIRKIKNGESRNTLLTINILKDTWKKFREMMNNMWSENISVKFANYSKKSLKKKAFIQKFYKK